METSSDWTSRRRRKCMPRDPRTIVISSVSDCNKDGDFVFFRGTDTIRVRWERARGGGWRVRRQGMTLKGRGGDEWGWISFLASGAGSG